MRYYIPLILESVPTKEIAEAVLSASGAIASLLLVFIAFLFAKADSVPASAPDDRAEQYILYARLGLIPVTACAAEMLAAYGWLFYPGVTLLFYVWSIGFILVTVLLVAYALLAVLRG